MNDPCKTCGSDVRIRHTRMPATLDEAQGQPMEVRVCTNRRCASNTGQMTLADVV